MTKENVSLDFRLKKINEARNYLFKEIKRNDLMSEKHKKVRKDLNYLNHFLVFASAVSSCASISVFTSVIGAPLGFAGSSGGI